MKLEINFTPESTEFGINLLNADGKDNDYGIVVCHGKLAGCDHLPEEDKEVRVKTLEGMVALWNNYYGDLI